MKKAFCISILLLSMAPALVVAAGNLNDDTVAVFDDPATAVRVARLCRGRLLLLGLCQPEPVDPALFVSIGDGDLAGAEENGAAAFKGIPYAAPPTGTLRWQSPQPPARWPGIRNASRFGPRCVQPDEDPDGNRFAIGVEDCLTINVWAPVDRGPDASLPVMFYVHGGANLFGGSAESTDFIIDTSGGPAWYDGSRVAANGDVIVVTFNYRLGALGYLAHDGMTPNAQSGTVGNYGLLDQVHALRWVQDNIAAFGGDPSRVLLMGQSAGAYNVCSLLVSPLTAGLFSRVAMHSGSCDAHTAEVAQANAEAVVAEVGCADAPDLNACLMAVSGETFALADSVQPPTLGLFNMFQHVDGYALPDIPVILMLDSLYHQVPILVGSNSEEYYHRFADITPLVYIQSVRDLVGIANRDAVLAMYPLSDYESPSEALATIYADRNINCVARLFAGVYADRQTEPVFRYLFSRVLSSELRFADGAYHSSELLYFFQHMNGGAFTANDDDRAVSQSMLRYWTRFAATGDPNDGVLPAWPEFDSELDPFQVIDVTPTTSSRFLPDKCDLWESLAAYSQDPPQ